MKKLEKYYSPDGKTFLSPSAINTYLACRLKFYFRYIEELKEPEEITDSIEANVFGSILHKAMYLLYYDFRKKTLDKATIKSLRENKAFISSVIDRSFNEEFFRQGADKTPEYKGRNLIIREVISTYIEGILKYDEDHTSFKIESLEEKYTCPVFVESAGKEILLGGFIDRIDIKDSVTRIIDYKTGKRENNFRDISSLFSAEADSSRDPVLQSFLYSWILIRAGAKSAVQPGLYFIRNIKHKDFDPLIFCKSGGRKPVEDFNVFCDEFEQALYQVLNELFNEESYFDQTPNDDNCRYCPYRSICWRGEEY